MTPFHLILLLLGATLAASCAVAALAQRRERRLLLALGACVLAALPGVFFFAHVTASAARLEAPVGHHLWSFGPARLGAAAGPALLLWSSGQAAPLRAPRFVDGLRFWLALAWFASSCHTVTCDPAF